MVVPRAMGKHTLVRFSSPRDLVVGPWGQRVRVGTGLWPEYFSIRHLSGLFLRGMGTGTSERKGGRCCGRCTWSVRVRSFLTGVYEKEQVLTRIPASHPRPEGPNWSTHPLRTHSAPASDGLTPVWIWKEWLGYSVTLPRGGCLPVQLTSAVGGVSSSPDDFWSARHRRQKKP